ncbi:hypothetical protein F5148DRAFT_1306203, partial [Russula earlei]
MEELHLMAFEYGQHNVEQDIKSIEKQDVPHMEKHLQQHTYSTQCTDARAGGELRPVSIMLQLMLAGSDGPAGIWVLGHIHGTYLPIDWCPHFVTVKLLKKPDIETDGELDEKNCVAAPGQHVTHSCGAMAAASSSQAKKPPMALPPPPDSPVQQDKSGNVSNDSIVEVMMQRESKTATAPTCRKVAIAQEDE